MAKQTEDNNDILAEIGDEKNPIVLSINKFKALRLFDIRRYYLDNKTKSIKPTPKGISIKEDEYYAMEQFIQKNSSLIRNSFTKDLSISEKKAIVSRREKKALEQKKNYQAKVSYERWNGPIFFQFKEKGGEVSLVLNRNRKKILEIEEENITAEDLLINLLDAYQNAKRNTHFQGSKDIDSFFEDFESNWGSFFK